MRELIPLPTSIQHSDGVFTLGPDARVIVDAADAAAAEAGRYLIERLQPATGFDLPLVGVDGQPPHSSLTLTAQAADPALGDEGYELTIEADEVRLAANQAAGLIHGVQTIRQLLPPAIESATALNGTWQMSAGVVRDIPRFAWRGAMLDVARHFFPVPDVKRFIDLMAYYKLNRLHLHLSDDQGWRIMIHSWPRLAEVGGSSQVGGGKGGYFSQADYSEIVDYAQRRAVLVVPEIDLPGHTNAALASYPELNCDDQAPALYSGIEVGFSSLCVRKEITYKFLDDVIGELAELTPGPYLHIGGDEAAATSADDYRYFIERLQGIVHAHGKRMIGWEEIGQVNLQAGAIAQHWHSDLVVQAARKGAQAILSPAWCTYLDMMYTADSPLGQSWAGCVDVKESYDWEPAALFADLPESAILGVEAPLWSETVVTMGDIEYLALPRLAGIAEIGWSPREGRGWEEYRRRLGAHGRRLEAMGVNFYRSSQVYWGEG